MRTRLLRPVKLELEAVLEIGELMKAGASTFKTTMLQI